MPLQKKPLLSVFFQMVYFCLYIQRGNIMYIAILEFL